jgi:glycosyltransferase involved in cell wall biosynthesis
VFNLFHVFDKIKLEKVNMNCLSVIIPAYNEGKRVLNVVQALYTIEDISEIILVDDGSEDETYSTLQSYLPNDHRCKLVRHTHNLGKGQAVFTAWQYVSTDIVLLLDADLIGLTPDHVRALFNPVLSGLYDMTLGIFKGGDIKTDFSHWITPWLTGQRCMRRDMMNDVSFDAATGYGLETAITVVARQMQWKVKRVPLYGMSHPISELHRGGIKGFTNRIKMYKHIITAWYKATLNLHRVSAPRYK